MVLFQGHDPWLSSEKLWMRDAPWLMASMATAFELGLGATVTMGVVPAVLFFCKRRKTTIAPPNKIKMVLVFLLSPL